MIFGSDGALTGVKGVTAVAALIKGLDIPTSTDSLSSDRDQDVEENSDSAEGTIIQLSDIPFTGLFRVGKKF